MTLPILVNETSARKETSSESTNVQSWERGRLLLPLSVDNRLGQTCKEGFRSFASHDFSFSLIIQMQYKSWFDLISIRADIQDASDQIPIIQLWQQCWMAQTHAKKPFICERCIWKNMHGSKSYAQLKKNYTVAISILKGCFGEMYIANNSIGDIQFTNLYCGGIYVKNIITITLKKTAYKRDNSIC